MPTIKTEPETPAGNKRSLEQLLGNLEPLLKPSEVAEYCGVHERTVWDLCSKGDIKSVRIGAKSIRIKLSDLVAFIEARSQSK
jgi:excisionase family DNA binding protein